MLIGQSCFAIFAQYKLYWFTCGSNLILSFGSNSLALLRMVYTKEWFNGNEIAFALGLSVGISEMGIVIDRFVTPIVLSWSGSFIFCLWTNNMYIMLSFVCCLVIIVLDQYSIMKAIKIDEYREEVEQTGSLKAIQYWLIGFAGFFWSMSFNCFMEMENRFLKERFNPSDIRMNCLNV